MKNNIDNRKVWFSSDFHGFHSGITRGTSSWENKQGCRDFDTVEEMTQTLIDNINRVVGEDDVLYFLGDWTFGGIKSVWNFRKQLKVREIHLIFGNHDEKIEANKFVPDEQLPEFVREAVTGKYKLNSQCRLQDLFTSVSYYKEITINRQKIILCHYAMRVWNHSHHNSWMLYGHSHGTLDDKQPKFPEATWIGDGYYITNSKSMDVGVDCHPEFRPFSFDEVKAIMDSRQTGFYVDHHTSETN